MTELPLISIIIPVYNVEQYLDTCLQSVVQQTYSNIEIILVDDGSTDDSGKICEEWAQRDPRIRLIHQENGGLSAARNSGLEVAQGEYIGFVDSDDYVSTDMYETLYKMCTDYNLPLSCARFDTFGDDGGWDDKPETGIVEVLSAHELLKIITWPRIDKQRFASISVWDRLYKRELIEGMRFPDGKVYEDIVYSTQVIQRAGQCVYINKSLYHYRIRINSITINDISKKQMWLTDKLPLEKEMIQLLEQYGYYDVATMKRYSACIDLYLYEHQCDELVKKRSIQKEIDNLHLTVHDTMNYIPGIMNKIRTSAIVSAIGFFNKLHIWKSKRNVSDR